MHIIKWFIITNRAIKFNHRLPKNILKNYQKKNKNRKIC